MACAYTNCYTLNERLFDEKKIITAHKHKAQSHKMAYGKLFEKKHLSVRQKSFKFKVLLNITIYDFGPGPGRKLRWPGAGAIFYFPGPGPGICWPRPRTGAGGCGPGLGPGPGPRSLPAVCPVLTGRCIYVVTEPLRGQIVIHM